MASGDCDEALKTIVGRAAQNLGYDNHVKAEQMKVVASVVHGRDVFAVHQLCGLWPCLHLILRQM